jgi:ribosomal protein L37AE/L43A
MWTSHGLTVDEIITKALRISRRLAQERTEKAVAQPVYADQSKICPECGKRYYRRKSTSAWIWQRSVYCSRRCQCAVAGRSPRNGGGNGKAKSGR